MACHVTGRHARVCVPLQLFQKNKPECLAAVSLFDRTYTTGDSIEASPALYNGTVLIGSSDYSLYCLSQSSGVKLWSYATGDEIDTSPVVDADRGRVYFSSDDG